MNNISIYFRESLLSVLSFWSSDEANIYLNAEKGKFYKKERPASNVYAAEGWLTYIKLHIEDPQMLRATVKKLSRHGDPAHEICAPLFKLRY